MPRYFVTLSIGSAPIALAAAMFCIHAAHARDATGAYTLSLVGESRLMVEAAINGRPVSALLDSAAESTILDEKFAQSLNIRDGQAVAGQGSGQTAFKATIVTGVTLEAVGLSLKDQSVAVADLSDVGRRLLNHPINVILGREIFDATRLAIDIAAQTIAVVPRTLKPWGARLALVTEHGVETVPVSVEGNPAVRATFDLGNGSHVLVSPKFASQLNLLTDGRAVTTEKGGGLGGETTRRVLRLRYVDLAGKRFRNVEAAIDPQPSASDINIGVSILRHFRITTDFSKHLVWLEPRG